MKKIFISAKDLNIGGVETSLIFLLNKLVKNYEIDLMLYEKGELIDKLDKNINILMYDDYFKNNLNDKLYKINKNIKTKSLLKIYKNKIKKKYDISIAYYGFENYIDMVSASVDSKRKIIWVHNDFLSSIKNKKFKLLYYIMYKIMGRKFKYFDDIVCVSKYTEENFIKLFKMNNTCCIHNYIDGKYVIDKSKEKTDIIFNNVFNIVACGRLTSLKNFDKTIYMINELKEINNNIHLYIIGDGEEYNSLLSLINSLNLNQYITLLGNQVNPYNIIKQADLFISMSRYESFGNVLIESMILSVPYLSNINSGSKDIYENFTPNGLGNIISNDNMLNKLVELINKKDENDKFDYNIYNKKVDEELNGIIKLTD